MICTIFLWYLFSNKDFLDTLLWMIRYEREKERETRKEREVLISGRRTEHWEEKKRWFYWNRENEEENYIKLNHTYLIDI